MPALETGLAAPKFKLPDMKGGQFSLEETLQQGPLLLAFFKVSCPVCQFTFPFLERLYKSLEGKNSPAIIGISQNSQKDTQAFMREFGVTFPVLLDDPRGYPVSNAYGITNVPTLFYIGPDGTIEVSSVGWSRNDLNTISQSAGQNARVANISVFRAGEQVPDFKAG